MFCLNYYTRAENTSRTKDAVIWIPNYWNPESRGLESGIQLIQRGGIRNPEGWNPESNSVTWGDTISEAWSFSRPILNVELLYVKVTFMLLKCQASLQSSVRELFV